jgi:hypothetical protein
MKKLAIFIGCPTVTLSACDRDNSSSAPTAGDFPQGTEWVLETVAISPPVHVLTLCLLRRAGTNSLTNKFIL